MKMRCIRRKKYGQEAHRSALLVTWIACLATSDRVGARRAKLKIIEIAI